MSCSDRLVRARSVKRCILGPGLIWSGDCVNRSEVRSYPRSLFTLERSAAGCCRRHYSGRYTVIKYIPIVHSYLWFRKEPTPPPSIPPTDSWPTPEPSQRSRSLRINGPPQAIIVANHATMSVNEHGHIRIRVGRLVITPHGRRDSTPVPMPADRCFSPCPSSDEVRTTANDARLNHAPEPYRP